MQNNHYNELRFSLGNSDFTFFIDATVFSEIVSPYSSRSRKHAHKFFELFYITQGNMNMNTEKEGELSFSSGEVVLVSPNAVHSSKISNISNRITMAFTVKKSSRSGGDFFTAFDKISKSEVTSFKNFSGGEAFSRLIRYYSGNFSDKDELIVSCLREIVILLKASVNKEHSAFEGTTPDSENHRHYIIDQYLSLHYKDGSLEELSSLLHLSTRHTSRMIKNLYKQSFRQQVLHIKLLEAKDLLRSTTLSVEEIATELGYINTNNFYNTFKKHCGVSPLKYRKMA